MGGGLTLLGLLGDVEESPWPSPVQKFEGGKACRCLGYFANGEQQVGQELVPVLPIDVHDLRSICFKVLLNRSTSPLVWGWYTNVWSCLTCRRLSNPFNTRDMKHEPWSVSISLAIPTRLNRSISSLATALAVAREGAGPPDI